MLQVVANGGIAVDVHAPNIVYASSKTQGVVWRVDLTAGEHADAVLNFPITASRTSRIDWLPGRQGA